MTEIQSLSNQRPVALQALMAKFDVDLYLIPIFDEHLNNYLAEYKKRLSAITGFYGSAGTVVMSRGGNHQLFVDARYHLQAEQQAYPGEFEIQKLGLDGVPKVEEWLQQTEKTKGAVTIGFDPFTMSPKLFRMYRNHLKSPASQLRPMTPNLVDQIWEDRPTPPAQPLYAMDTSVTGESVESKLKRVREAMRENGVTALVLTKLDEIAWLTNLRGNDTQYTPVFEAYAIVELEKMTCFTLTPPTKALAEQLAPWIQFQAYTDYPSYLETLSEQKALKVWLDPTGTTMGSYLALQKGKTSEQVTTYQFEKSSPIPLMKAQKNKTELEKIQQAHYHSACAKIRAFAKLDEKLAQGETISEQTFSDWLTAEYQSETGFTGLSFPNIVGFGANSAIIHYSHLSPDTYFQSGNLLLVDSGIQLMGGTTDDTRTLIIGTPDEKQKHRYTKVLQAHIQLASLIFPSGANGVMLDAITRAPLWKQGLDFLHGTGHGVGAFLNVHEGPHSIGPNTVKILPNMIFSNEPGYYEAGWGGIRLENLYTVVPATNLPQHPGGKEWLRLKPLTLIPFEKALVDFSALTQEEKNWLKDYHQLVWDTISPKLPENAKTWLQSACSGW